MVSSDFASFAYGKNWVSFCNPIPTIPEMDCHSKKNNSHPAPSPQRETGLFRLLSPILISMNLACLVFLCFERALQPPTLSTLRHPPLSRSDVPQDLQR